MALSWMTLSVYGSVALPGKRDPAVEFFPLNREDAYIVKGIPVEGVT